MKSSPSSDVFQNQIDPWLFTYPDTPTASMYCPAASACGVVSAAVCCHTRVLLTLMSPVSTGFVFAVANASWYTIGPGRPLASRWCSVPLNCVKFCRLGRPKSSLLPHQRTLAIVCGDASAKLSAARNANAAVGSYVDENPSPGKTVCL